MSSKILRLGTRGSKLALWQANATKDKLEAAGHTVEVTIIKTSGDQIQHLGFDKMEGKGFFTKEIEESLLSQEIDFAVHSMKDLSTEMPEGLVITAISERAAPNDILIFKKEAQGDNIIKIKENAVIGTSSVRRKVQLKDLLPQTTTIDIRGNVPTRLQKLQDQSDLDGIVLAKAGIDRLEIDLSAFETFSFHTSEFVPAPAQGVLAFQARKDDMETRKALQVLHSRATLETVKVERTILKSLDGGCQTPVGIYCDKDARGVFHCHMAYAKDLNSKIQRARLSQSTHINLADNILKQINL